MARFEMGQNSSRLPTPALLRRGLEQIESGPRRRYFAVRDTVTGKVNSFTEAEFFILEQLSSHDDFERLQHEYTEKFLAELTEVQLNAFIRAVNRSGLWGAAAMKHPIVGQQIRAVNAPSASYWQGRNARGQARRRLRRNQLALTNASVQKLERNPRPWSDSSSSNDSEAVSLITKETRVRAEEDHFENEYGQSAQSSSREGTGAGRAGPGNAGKSWSEHDFEEAFSVPYPGESGSGAEAGGKRRYRQPTPTAKPSYPALHLFNPEPFLDALQGVATPLGKLCFWLTPLLLVNAIFLLVNHASNISFEFYRLFGVMSFLEHMLISIFVVNLFSMIAMGFVARSYHVPVSSFSLALFFRFIPRFAVLPAVTRNTSKKIRYRIVVTPLLVKLFLCGAGIVLWYLTRSVDNALSVFFLNLAGMSAFAFVFTLNPLFAASGYYLLTIFLDEPQLQARSFAALKARLTGKPVPEGTGNLFAVYGLCCLLFTLLMMALILATMARLLHLHFSTTGIVVFASFIGLNLVGFVSSLRANRKQESKTRALMQVQPSNVSPSLRKKKARRSPWRVAIKLAVLAALAGVMYLPYEYSANGSLVIKPLAYQEITTDIEGIVEAVYFDGGEFVAKGELLAKFETSQAESQVRILNARIKAQQAMLDNLRARPTREQLSLAQRTLDVELTKLNYSKDNLDRKTKIYRQSVISLEEFQNAQRAYHVDLGNVEQARANLELVKAGATPEELLAAESELQRWVEERDLYQDRVERSHLYMPIDGKILTLYLKQKVGQFQEEGEPFAEVENTSQVLGEIEVPEVDIGVITVGSSIQVRVWSYHDELFQGEVINIDPNVEEKSFGNIVKVITLLDNSDQKLRTGMTGYAKINAETRPVWEVLFLTIKRFVLVEMWSWLP